MLDNIPDEYEIDPGTDIDRLADLFVEQYPDAVRHDIDEAIFVDDGPINYLAWMALDGYSRHEFFYYDSDPDGATVRRLLSWSPTEDDMQLLKAYFLKEFETVERIPNAAFIEVSDKYLPGAEPSANVAFYQNPVGDEVNIGLNATPPQQEEEILEDVNRLVPAKDLETFAKNVVYSFYDELKTTAEQHLLEGDVRQLLDADPDFRQQTTKLLPDGIYPTYTGKEADLWQKPVSKEPAIEGSQGFVQIWVPDVEEQIGFVTVTSGDYDTEQALADVQSALVAALN